ncbi:sensor domain-containing protein, partial [Streptomyces sp. MP131-18]|uniref:sensor domain-containing protein n=1 Tax=Streptomyces sp. MP131-18 TaxID=1857892 RepID=UPI0015699614
MNTLRMPFTLRTWREGLYALLNLPMALVGFLMAVTGLSISGALLITFVGLPLMALVLLLLRLFGGAERARARLLLGMNIAAPEPLRMREGSRGGPLAWTAAMLRSNVSWRSAAYALLHLPWAIFSFTVVAVCWSGGWALLTFPLWFWTIPAYTDEPGVGINTDGEGGGWIWDGPFEVTMAVVIGLLLLIAGAWLIRGMGAVDRMLVAGLLGPSAAATRMW